MMTTTTIDASILKAMRKQEQAYACGDYLYQQQQQHNGSRRLNLPQNAINVACRSSMIQWMQTVVNFIGFDPETVEISMSYLDRFLDTDAGDEAIQCRTMYQLAAMTALYTAVKINCAEALTPKLLAELSQGSYQAEQFEEMERIMLHAIHWRVNPPTATAFCRETIDMLPTSLFETEDDDTLRQSVLDLARTQAEWAVGDYELLSVKKSVIAFAAVANALDRLKIRSLHLTRYLRESLNNTSSDSLDLELDLKQAMMLRKTLCEALPEAEEGEESNMSASHQDHLDDDNASVKSVEDNDPTTKRMSVGKSPRSVISRNLAA